MTWTGQNREKVEMNSDVRQRGRVTGVHPPTRDGDRLKGGFVWIVGDDDGVSYFGHVTQIMGSKPIADLKIGDRCSFNPAELEKGPAALLIEFEECA